MFIKGEFDHLDTLISDQGLATNFRLASGNHFNRAFLEHEFIPLMKIVLDVVNSEVAYNDTGGDCFGGQCPTDGTTCDPTNPTSWSQCKCDGKTHGCGEFGNFSCVNPVFNGELDTLATTLRSNISSWTNDINSLLSQAQKELESKKIVAKATVDIMTAKFLFYMTRVQSPVQKTSCGYNFTTYETPCSGCQAAQGAKANQIVTTRNLSYIPING